MEHFHLHPIMVHFPIALYTTALAMEILSVVFKKEVLHQAACYNYLFGILGAAAAVFSAWWDNELLKHSLYYTHRNLAYITLTVSLILGTVLLLIKRKSGRLFRSVFILVLIAVVALVSATGFYGGKLVYEYGVGVAE